MQPSILYFGRGTRDPVFALIECTLVEEAIKFVIDWLNAMFWAIQGVMGVRGGKPNLNLRVQRIVKLRLRCEE